MSPSEYATTDPSDPRYVPAQLGRYRRDAQPLGQGGAGLVFKGHDPNLRGVSIAIKVLDPSYVDDEELCDRFLAEAHELRKMESAGIVRIYDVDEHHDPVNNKSYPYIVMELCVGGTLKDRLDRLDRPLTHEEALGLAHAITTGLAPLHQSRPGRPHGLVHRDIKPLNLLIRTSKTRRSSSLGELLASNEEVVVADLGLAKTVSLDLDDHTGGPGAGTRGWSAPEQFNPDTPVTPAADIFAASAVMVWALTLVAPTPLSSPHHQAFPDAVFAKTGPLESVLRQGLAYTADSRPPDIRDWLESLLPPSNASNKEGRRSSLVWAAGITIVAAFIAAVAISASSPGASSEQEPAAPTSIADPDTEQIKIISGPTLTVNEWNTFSFAYETNEVCGTGSFSVTNLITGAVFRFDGDDTCWKGPHGGSPPFGAFKHIPVQPDTPYDVFISIRGISGDGIWPTGLGKDTARLERFTTPSRPADATE